MRDSSQLDAHSNKIDTYITRIAYSIILQDAKRSLLRKTFKLHKTDYACVREYRTLDLLDTSKWGSTLALTLNLKQGRRSECGRLVWLDEYECRKTFAQFMNRLNRATYKNAHKRRGKRLRVVGVLEKGDDGRWHFHVAVECPDHLSQQQFRLLIDNCWSTLDWSYGLHVQPVYDQVGWTKYMLKLRQKSGLASWGDAIDLDSTHNPPV
jgi:hypothetical protein